MLNKLVRSPAIFLLIGILNIHLIQSCTVMSKKRVFPSKEFSWGEDCMDSIAIGLSLSVREVELDSPFTWSWAIKNNSDTPRKVTLRHDLDKSFRCRLQILRPGELEPLFEFYEPHITFQTIGNSRDSITLIKGFVEVRSGGEAGIDSSWGSGLYQLRVIFGGDSFNFKCLSGVVNIIAK